MIFAHMLDQVLDGSKTQTRRLAKPRDEFFLEELGDPAAVMHRGVSQYRLLWQVGKDYAVCPGRGKKQVSRIRVLDLRHEDVRSISVEDAKAEGWAFNPLQPYTADPVLWYLRLWAMMHDKRANVRMGQLLPEYWQAYLTTRPAEHWQAWAITFELVKGAS